MLRGNFSKKAISPLVATIIIISVTIVAGISLFVMVQSLINKPLGEDLGKCQDVTYTLDSGNTCFRVVDNTGTKGIIERQVDVSIDRTRSVKGEPIVVGWKLILDGGEGERITIDTGWVVEASQQSSFTYILSQQEITAIGGEVKSISVYPIIETGKAELSCSKIIKTIKKLNKCVGSVSEDPPDMCGGLQEGQCSIDKPEYCVGGELIDNCDICECPAGLTCDFLINGGSGTCEPLCTDGTTFNQCSSDLPLFCVGRDRGNLLPRCGEPELCGCPEGSPYCEPEGELQVGQCSQKCFDGTPFGECSLPEPSWCDPISKVLIPNCEVCGTCTDGSRCDLLSSGGTGTCRLTCNDPGKTFWGECVLNNKPEYCDAGSIINNCQECECPNNDPNPPLMCQLNGECGGGTQEP